MEILHDYPGEGQGFNDSMVISRFCLVATMQCWFVSPCHLFSACLCKVIKVISPDLSFFVCPFDPFQLHSKLISPVILRFASAHRSSFGCSGVSSSNKKDALHPFLWIFPIVFPVISSSWLCGVLQVPMVFSRWSWRRTWWWAAVWSRHSPRASLCWVEWNMMPTKVPELGWWMGWRGWGWAFFGWKDSESCGFSQVFSGFLGPTPLSSAGVSRPQPQVSAPMVCSWASSESELSLSRDEGALNPHHLLWKEFRFSWREQLLRNSWKTLENKG